MLLRTLLRLTPARNAAARAASIRRISSEKTPHWYRNEPHWWRYAHEQRSWGFFSISAAIIVWWWLPGIAEREQLKMMNVQLQRVIVLLEAQNSARAREGRY